MTYIPQMYKLSPEHIRKAIQDFLLDKDYWVNYSTIFSKACSRQENAREVLTTLVFEKKLSTCAIGVYKYYSIASKHLKPKISRTARETTSNRLTGDSRFATYCRKCNRMLSKQSSAHYCYRNGKLVKSVKCSKNRRSHNSIGKTGYYCSECAPK